MRKLDESKVYSLEDLTSEELKQLTNSEKCAMCYYEFIDGAGWVFKSNKSITREVINAKELFYTLENIQVDCSELSEEQIKEMADVFKANGYKIWEDYSALDVSDVNYLLEFTDGEVFVSIGSEDKTTITYEKFMEFFSNKEENFKKLVEVLNEELTEKAYEVSYIAEKPKQYQIGIDTFNPQPHYNNENGSLYKIANDLGLNHWEFDIFKRLVRCRKKNQFKEDLQKIKDTIDIYLNEFTDEK